MILTLPSGIARPLRASALSKPAFRQAFQPKAFAPAISQRFASTDSAKDGKIHQVIGAVVDGKRWPRSQPGLPRKTNSPS